MFFRTRDCSGIPRRFGRGYSGKPGPLSDYFQNENLKVAGGAQIRTTTNRNRLHKVTDAAGVALYDDISNNQSDSNYVYDRLGQLTGDISEGITNMNWRKGDKKLRSMTRSNHVTQFLYDPFGRRIAKIYRPNGTADKTLWTYTYYANDANGATMAVYDIRYNTDSVYLKEQHLYGAGRLGMVQLNKAIYANAVIVPPLITISTNTLGNKRYELTNHLGNVNAVITDRKAPNPDYSTLAHEFDFATTGQTGWSYSACSGFSVTLDNGRLKFYPGNACAMNGSRDFAVASGKPYTISVDIDRTSIANFNVEIYTAPTSGGTGTLVTTITNPANGTLTYTFTPGQNFIRVLFRKNSNEHTSFYIDNLRIQTMASPYMAMVIMTSDYYPFGYQMPGRHKEDGAYRYGYNGMEKDKEMHGEGNSYTTEFRQYDPRLGRWLSLDPMMHQFPWMSPYAAFENNPVYYIDPLGLDGEPPITGKETTGQGSPDGKYIFLDGKWTTGTTDAAVINPRRATVWEARTYNIATPVADNAQYNLPRESTTTLKQKEQELKERFKPRDVYMTDGRDMSIRLAEDMARRYDIVLDNAIPGWELAQRLAAGEKITATDVFIEGIGFIPAGKIIGRGKKLFYNTGKQGDKLIDVSTKKIALCFVKGTKVSTDIGLEDIENIQVGDSVWAFDEITGDKAFKVVYNIVVRQTDHLLQLRIGSDTLKTTDDHPFYVDGKWVKALNLNVGDSLNLLNGGKVSLSEKSRIDTIVTVYNFGVENYATYYVGVQQILVHNNPCGGLPKVTKAVNSNMPHAVERSVERGIFDTPAAAREGLNNLTKKISSGDLPMGTILDPSYTDRILVPIGNNGLASYQIAKNGTAKLKTVLIAKP